MNKCLAVIIGIHLLLFSFRVNAQQPDLTRLHSLMESFRFGQALGLANQYLSRDSTLTDALLVKGKALSALYRYKESITTLQKAAGNDSTSTVVLNELLNVYRLSGDMDKAIETCRKMNRIDPGNRYFSLQLANLLYSDKEYPSAAARFLLLHRADTSDFYVVKQLGNCFDEMKRNDSAEFFYRKALVLSPDDAVVTGKLANLLIRKEEVNTAYYLTAVFLQRNPHNVPILKINAYCNYLILDYPACSRQLKECLLLGDSSKFTRKYLGLSYYKQDKYDSAAPQFLAAFQGDNNDAEVCFYYGVSQNRLLNADTGLVYLHRTEALLLPPGQFLCSLYSEIAASYTSKSMPDTAAVLLKKALEVNPGNNTLRFKLAYQYDYYLRKPNQALPWYREFLKNVVPLPEHDPLDEYYQHPAVDNTKTEVQFSMPDYARDRIRAITGAKR